MKKKTHPKGQMYFEGPNKTPRWKESSLPISKKRNRKKFEKSQYLL